MIWANISKLFLTALVLMTIAFSALYATTGSAAAETRSLKILFVHTGEKQEITFKRNGRYDPKGLQQLNNIVRDWRRNEATKMDPRLFDLVWSVYQKAGASGYIYVVSGYRSPATNAMLRSRSSGVAKESQHMNGTAMDFFIPGVPLKNLRDIGMKFQAGGVGYYPNSGSPFVHMDVAGVRSWPRVPRSELVRMFPDGKPLHIPADGKPLPGYQVAMEEYKKRLGSEQILMADNKSSPRGRPRNLMAMLFGSGDEDEGDEDSAPAAPVRASAPAATPRPAELTNPTPTSPMPVAVASAAPDIAAPVPQSRPSLRQGDDSLAVALYSPGGRNAAEDALQKVAGNPSGDASAQQNGYEDLAAYKVPVPTLLGPRGMKGDAEPVMTASLGSPDDSNPIAQHIPVPAGRPALADAMAATLPQQRPQMSDEPSTVEEAMLSPAAAEALQQSQDGAPLKTVVIPRDRPTPSVAPTVAEVRPAAPVERPQPVAAPAVQPKAVAVLTQGPLPAQGVTQPPAQAKAQQQQVASLAQPSRAKPSAGQFGDVFDQPKSASRAGEASLPVKGGRPGPSEADAASRGLTGGTELTRTMISQWAMNKNRIEPSENSVPNKAGRGGRVVTQAITAPVEASQTGFTPGAQAIDPGRFGAVR
ncbi:DUF882 domain-containing protein [Agrobacterium vitis]|uniref:DUF882 domain-containing protein n=1 Tax=Agrobacterium vitis TaxID=373 RepID=UPI001F4422DE|nr:DUF882 domain-containing protein [Agrobacterium vitis]